MRKFILAFLTLLIVFGLSYSQEQIATLPRSLEWAKIYPLDGEAGLIGIDSDGLDTTYSFKVSGNYGNGLLWIEFGDTTDLGANESAANYDSCLTVYLDLYNSRTGTWGKLYNTAGKLDTLDRDLITTSGAAYYINLPKFTNYQAGGKTTYGRIRLSIGVDDSLYISKIFFGTQ